MLRRLAVALPLLALLFAARAARADETCACDLTPAACDTGCACDTECSVDWSADECAAPDAGCQPETDPDEATLETEELAAPVEDEDPPWPSAAADVACPDGATASDGHCVPAASAMAHADVEGGCTTGGAPGLVIVAAVLLLAFGVRRRRRALAALALAACALGPGGWDDAVENGPPGDPSAFLDVYAADLPAGSQYLLANQALAPGADAPAAQFSLLRAGGDVPLFRFAGACGDQLGTAPTKGAELLGWARAGDGDGTAALVELVAPDGCALTYETDPAAIADLEADGYTETATIAHVWPPGMDDAAIDDTGDDTGGDADPADAASVQALATPAACAVTKHSPVEMMYASPGGDYTLRFLVGCPGEVIVGEKDERGPRSAMKSAAAHAAGGRTAFVLDRNGDKLRALLGRSNGVERTAAYLRHKLAEGYDYIAIDEITAAPDFADGTRLNRQIRQLLLRMPPRTIIPYISIDLTQEAGGAAALRARRLLLRAFARRARVLALEVYLHTDQVMAGEAPSVFRTAADRLQRAVHGLKGVGALNRRSITTIGTSMHSTYAQYRYLDDPAHDLTSITRQVRAIRHGSRRLREQRGIGWYFVNASDMAPRPHTYSYASLIHRMRVQALRFR